ncbi:PREDICTED: odorant receptor 22c-like [Wasmannia auropunctata]|uniref:odorant receptor 22c-like n=1 Tax=Wasmannia auropunctata TaxID=64793 RepID=UPI0005EF7F24|nr:PREDICTED: odorant receptor 22c-like [Wasmannia auropunctata]
MLHVCTVATLNGLIFTLVLHASGQIDIICQEFKDISKNLLYGSSVPSFGMLIERHNKIISFSENIEELLSFIALMQVIWNTLVICCLGFVIIISIHNETGVFMVMKTACAYFAIMAEAFVICFAGEYLSLKSKLISYATYETLWYDMPANTGKIIMFIIMRSQRRLTITAGKMMDMSFETFTSIMKTTASYISVLNALY